MTTTTLAAINAQSGIYLRTSARVEGIPYVFTDGSTTAETSAVSTAHGADDTYTGIGGLTVLYNLGQTLHPWEPFDGSSSRVTLSVQDPSDVLGPLVFKREPTVRSPLAEDVDPDETAITVKRSDGYATDSGGHGTIHIGCEAIYFDANDTGSETFTGCERGRYSPFKTFAGDGFGRTHYATPVMPGVDLESTSSTLVTQEPIEWRGRWVGVWLHRVVDGVLDAVSQAHLVFAGKILETEETDDGRVLFHCEGVIDTLKEAVILRQQFRARLREGVWVKAGTRFSAGDNRAGTVKHADDLVVKAAGATPPYEVDEGFYTGDQLASAINDWLAQALSDGDLNFRLNFRYRADNGGSIRSALSMADGTAGAVQRIWAMGSTSEGVRLFFGWQQEGDAAANIAPINAVVATTGTAYSEYEPLRIWPWGDNGPGSTTMYIEDVQGSFVDQSTLLPSIPTSAYGILQVGNAYVPCAVPSVTNGVGTVVIYRPVNALLGQEDISQIQISLSESGFAEVTQVLVLESNFRTLVLALLASTGGANWPDYELLPEHCSAAVPYDLMTTDLEVELAAAPLGGDVMRIIIDRPKRLSEILEVSFILRHLQFVWRQGRIALKGFATPTAAATLTIGTDDRAAPINEKGLQRTITRQSEDWIRNVIKVLSGADAAGENFQDTTVIEIPGSVSNHGGRPLTLRARNAVRGAGAAGEDIRALIPTLVAPLSFLAYPATLMTFRTHFNLAEQATPGEVCLISDDFARDPSTGLRGLSSKPALIVGQKVYGWGGESGPAITELTAMLFPRLSLAPYCPCAQVDDGATNAGYVAGTKVLTCYAHEHSESSGPADASHFVAGSKVRVIQIDPSDPAAPLTWDDVVVSQTGNTMTLTTGLAGWDNTKKYRVYSDDYGDATTAQKANTFQADDADGQVADARAPYGLSLNPTGQASTFTGADGTELAERTPNAAYGDGVALDAGHARALARNANALVNHLTAPQHPWMMTETAFSGGGTWQLIAHRKVFVGIGRGSNVKTRKLYVAPMLKSASGTSSVRVTLCARMPSSANPASPSRDDITRPLPYTEATFSSSSATWATATPVGLDTSHLDLGEGVLGGWGWLLVEVNANASFRGMGVQRVGPMEAP